MHEEHNGALAHAERKQLLIAQGAAYRLGVSHSKAEMHSSLSAESFAKRLITNLAAGAVGALKGGSILKGSNLQIFLPLVIKGISKLSKKSVKPLARGALIIAAVTAITRFIIQKKKSG